MTQKTELIRVRCEPRIKQALIALAGGIPRRAGETLRDLVVREAQARGLWPEAGTLGSSSSTSERSKS